MNFFTIETGKDYFINITANILLLIFIPSIGWIWEKLKHRKFKKFWGNKIFKNPFIVLDVFNYNNSIQQNAAQRYFKNFHNQSPIPIVGVDKVMGVETARSARFVTDLFYDFSKKIIPIKTDEEVIGNWEGSFICFGSSDSNIKTKDILSFNNNNFLDFGFDTISGERVIHRKRHPHDITKISNKDKGMIVKITNEHFPEYKCFVCAGLGEWGTAGAVWYLANKWEKLLKDYGENDFGIVVEVTPLSVESTLILESDILALRKSFLKIIAKRINKIFKSNP